MPNELSYNEATCSQYYDSNLYCSTDGFPAYIYPTQSSTLIQEQRVEEYIKIMESCSNSPRGLAYYEEGFICALLDGHHKACAASVLGKMLKHHNEETEQYLINYLVDHTSKDECWDLVNSYWE